MNSQADNGPGFLIGAVPPGISFVYMFINSGYDTETSRFISATLAYAFGYDGAAATQTPVAQFGIRLLIGPVTATFFVLANIVLAFYPIDQKAYETIQGHNPLSRQHYNR